MYLAHKNITMAEPEALRTYRIEFGLPFLLFALMAIIPRRNPAQFGLKIAYLPQSQKAVHLIFDQTSKNSQ